MNRTVTSTAVGTVHYSVAGTGPGLVLVHGTGGDSRTNFGHLVEHFADRHTVVTPDFAGSGETSDPGGNLGLELLAAQVLAAADDAVDGPVDLLGFSLGALIAATAAAARPEKIRRLILLNGWVDNADPRHTMVFELWRKLTADEPELAPAFASAIGFAPAFLTGLGDAGIKQIQAGEPPAGTARQIELGLRADVSAALPQITAPTLVIGSTADYLVPVAGAKALHAGIAGSTYAELDSGHLVLFEKAAELVKLVRDFTARQ
ncbi:alpha/beta fold hydrolase [Yinghuangia soli]|uniref:Alpha/beta hydrolase n=1 Tax=Yinghuangia soli TaxID=2908204 RepID=A0AA41PWK7_9ACTN|nr:alpha/beta hydrolase [Yinghuangia soli]MCF2526506.1 alpha/beta hydrolase [Yinghuangia soli]